MLLSSVILLLRETLEAALLVSVLMAMSYLLRFPKRWLPYGMFAGLVLAYLYAANMSIVSNWFDYVGQEIVNAAIQTGIAIVLVVMGWAICRDIKTQQFLLYQVCAAVALSLVVTREGAEILMYLGGFLNQDDKLQAVLLGSGIGFSIGVSVAFLLFYGLLGLPRKWGIAASVALLALVAGNMLSQAVLQLTQADWISSSQALWDSSGWVAENSITGQLLYALIGYEATPSLAQVAAYLVGALLVWLALMIGTRKALRSDSLP